MNVSVFLLKISAKGLLGKPKGKRVVLPGPENTPIIEPFLSNYFYLILVSHFKFFCVKYLFTSHWPGLNSSRSSVVYCDFSLDVRSACPMKTCDEKSHGTTSSLEKMQLVAS